MKKYDSFLIGHITVDAIEEPNGSGYGFYGGAVLFSAYAAHSMGAKVGFVTKMTKEQEKIKDLLPFDREGMFFLASPQNTSMINRYLTEDRERRDLIVSSVAESFTLADIPADVESSVYHFGGLIYGDYAEDMIPVLAKRGKVAVDMQGYLRCLNRETNMLYFKDYGRKLQDFPHIHFLKTDAAEAEVLTGLTDRRKAAEMMMSWGAKEVMITHNTEVLVASEEGIFTCPIKSRNFSGRTGRGDTTFSVYLTERLSKSTKEALAFATAAVSLKMEHPGPLKKTRKEVEEYQKTFYCT